MGSRFRFTALKRVDLLVFIPVFALVVIGLLSVYSATNNAAVHVKFQKQVFWAILGAMVYLLILLSSPRFFHYGAYIIYAISLATLILVLLVGKKVSGNAGWFGIGSYGIQPAEFAKVATILALSGFLSDRNTDMGSLIHILTAIGIVAFPWALIILQPDFGTGLVYWAFFLPMIFFAGAEMLILITLVSPVFIAILSVLNLWYFLGAAILISFLFYFMKRHLGIALLFLVLNLTVGFSVQYLYNRLPAYQKGRIAVFLDPAQAPKAQAYNVIQAKVAIGSGGAFGKGYSQGSQTQLRFVPEQWTDFIFCVPAEEFGFVGGGLVLILFSLLVYRGWKISRTAQFRFSNLLATGLTSMLVFHIFVNIGMSVGLLPVIGIPLPFMSYGGSFFLTSVIVAGLLTHISMYLKGDD